MTRAKTADITTEPSAAASRRALIGGAMLSFTAAASAVGITAGAAASVADLVPSDTADAVLLALCARAEEQDRLMHVADELHSDIKRKHGRTPACDAARKQCNTHFSAFVDLAEQAAGIPALTMAGMRAKSRLLYINAENALEEGDLTSLILRDLGWGAY